MTLETAILLVQTLVTASIAGWLFLGLMDNYLTPSLNGGFARSVLTFERLKEMYPDDFARVQYREIKSPALHKTVFAVIVVRRCPCRTLAGSSCPAQFRSSGL